MVVMILLHASFFAVSFNGDFSYIHACAKFHPWLPDMMIDPIIVVITPTEIIMEEE